MVLYYNYHDRINILKQLPPINKVAIKIIKLNNKKLK